MVYELQFNIVLNIQKMENILGKEVELWRTNIQSSIRFIGQKSMLLCNLSKQQQNILKHAIHI